MPIKLIQENQQSEILKAYNSGKSGHEKIISTMRNADTGWPMMQMSLFIPVGERNGQPLHEAAFGGGKCHGFIFSAFGLAVLLGKLPGKVNMQIGRQNPSGDKPSWDNVVGPMHEGYKFTHNSIGITISSQSGSYGKDLNVNLPEEFKTTGLEGHLWDYEKHFKLPFLAGWQENEKEKLTDLEMAARINQELGAFYEGQLYIDTGKFFESCDPELYKFFKGLFKVDEALTLIQQNNLEPVLPVIPPAPKQWTKEELLLKELNALRAKLAGMNSNANLGKEANANLGKVYVNLGDKLFGSSVKEYIHSIGRVIGILGGMDVELTKADKKALHGGELHQVLDKYRDILPPIITENMDGVRSKLKDVKKGISSFGFGSKKSDT